MKRLFIFLLLSTLFLQCGKKSKEENEPPAFQAVQENSRTIVKCGIVARYSPRLIYEGYQPIMDYLTSHTDYHFELKLSKTYDEALDFLKFDSVQIAFLGTYSYIEAHDKFGARCVLKPLNRDGKPFFRGIIIVRDDSPIQKISDLKGKSFAFASKKATAGFLIPKEALYKANIFLSDLSKYTNIEHHNAIVNAVLRGEFDAGAVKDIIAYRNKEKGLRFIYVSPKIPSVPIVARKEADPKMIAQVKTALLKLNPADEQNRKIMNNWDEEFRYGFVEARDSDYDSIRQLIHWIHEQEKKRFK